MQDGPTASLDDEVSYLDCLVHELAPSLVSAY